MHESFMMAKPNSHKEGEPDLGRFSRGITGAAIKI